MTLIVLLCALVGAAEDIATPDLAGATTRLVIRLSTTLSLKTDNVGLDPDDSVTEREVIALQDSLIRSRLFNVLPGSRYRVALHRMNAKTMQVEISVNRMVIDSFNFQWPRPPIAREEPKASDQLDNNNAHQKFAEKRLMLRRTGIDSLSRTNTQLPQGYDPYLHPGSAERLGQGADAGFFNPSLDDSISWRIVQGDGSTLDERELARRLGDRELLRRIDQIEGRRRRRWHWGFGSAAGIGIASGTGALLVADGRSSREVLGASLLGAGVVFGALAVFRRVFASSHALGPTEVEQLIEIHNQRLRRTLGLDSLSTKSP